MPHHHSLGWYVQQEVHNLKQQLMTRPLDVVLSYRLQNAVASRMV
jgi:hypothetical protein